jgi:hypothetical protein
MAPFSKILSSRRSWLLVSLLGRPGENRTRRESAPRRRHSFRQRITELAAQSRRRATSFKENSSSNSFSARLRRSESSSAEPFGRIWTSCLLEVIIALFYVRSITVHIAMEYRRQEMDDLYAINAAKTEFRECFNLGDTSRMLAIADPDLVTFSDGQPSEFGETELDALKTRLDNIRTLYREDGGDCH